MSKSGTWSAVQQVDSMQFANCPMQMDDEFHYERDQNPAAWKSKDHWEWVKAGHVPGEKRIHNFYRDRDTDTVSDFYVEKEIMLGSIVDSKSTNFTGWSIVLRTVIRWEEREIMRQRTIIVHTKAHEFSNTKPLDLQQWEQTHDTSKRNVRKSRRNVRRRV
jgi:hypothetical protein